MKKKALATKMAAFVMAGAMTMAMGFPALADSRGTAEIDVKKTVKVEDTNAADYVYAPKTTFSFKLSAVKEAGNFTKDSNTYFVKPGLVNNDAEQSPKHISFEKGVTGITFDPAADKDGLNKSKSGVKIVVDYDGIYREAGAGIYHYTIEEETGSYDGVDYTKAGTYDIYVFVYENENQDAVVIAKDGNLVAGEGKSANIEFVNPYDVHTLTIEKLVTGNQGETNKKFDFTINVNRATGTEGEEYYWVICDSDGHEVTRTDGSNTHGPLGTGVTVGLTNTEQVKIYGLSAGDTYTVTEADYVTNDGYDEPTIAMEGGAASATKVGKKEVTGTITSDGKITYTNNRSVTTPTGIVTEYAPYILLVAAAGAFAVLFLRRKKEEF